MTRTAQRTEELQEDRVEVCTLGERLEAVAEEISAEPVPARLLEAAHALEGALSVRRQRLKPN